MAIPKQKPPKEAKLREATKVFDPSWNNKSGKVDTVAEYINLAAREPKGWHRGARVR